MNVAPPEFNRNDLASLVGRQSALEIGPFTNPILRGPKVKYFDVLDKQGLIKRADAIGYAYSSPVDIHYVSSNGDLSIVDEKFDFCLSSHCIEHQPDLIHHLKQVADSRRRGDSSSGLGSPFFRRWRLAKNTRDVQSPPLRGRCPAGRGV